MADFDFKSITIGARHGFSAAPMDDDHLAGALRSVSLDLVRAGLVARAGDGSWSSVRAHLNGRDDGIGTVAPMLERMVRPPALAAQARTQIQGRPIE